jgi:hypothetical protein
MEGGRARLRMETSQLNPDVHGLELLQGKLTTDALMFPMSPRYVLLKANRFTFQILHITKGVLLFHSLIPYS